MLHSAERSILIEYQYDSGFGAFLPAFPEKRPPPSSRICRRIGSNSLMCVYFLFFIAIPPV